MVRNRNTAAYKAMRKADRDWMREYFELRKKLFPDECREAEEELGRRKKPEKA